MSWLHDFYDMVGDVKVVAMSDVVRSTPEYNFRFILRWYSREFHTPLHLVSTLPLEDIVRAYYEVKYEDMPEHEREHEIGLLLETPEELRERQLQEDREEAEALEFAKEAQAQEAEATTPAEKLAAATNRFQQISSALKPPEKLPGPDVALPEPMQKLPPDIKMTFIEDDGFNDLMEGDFASRTQDDEE